VKATVNSPRVAESSWSPQLRDSHPTKCTGSPNKRMVHPEALLVENEVHSLGCAGCGEESWWIGTYFGVQPGFWVVDCEEWTTKRARPPCRLIASYRM
jgi:hypothetical protein